MPCCIAPGCTSGYKTNPEKVHFFYVPKDENLRQLWKIALKRRDLKSNLAVCEKHFLQTDILWQRDICDRQGNILGTVS